MTRGLMGTRWFAPLAALAALAFVAQPAAAVQDEFPAGFEGYHTYAEVGAALDQALADHGQGEGAILSRHVLGQTFEGRDIWAIKISDNVATDEDEPESLAHCGMHAREHLTVEMCLYMIALLTDNYGAPSELGERVTAIVDSTEIWIVPMLNPDGAEFDISDGVFHNWRKNRQPNPGSDKLGIDLNRNWDYRWNNGGSSAKPASATYRGAAPFEAVENVVLRDFMLSRWVNGEQQIKTAFNWHAFGELVLRPYGYTKADVPPDMTADDQRTYVALGKAMAATNGYRSRQSSDRYLLSGDFSAWAYATQRIFVFTVEMHPPSKCPGCGRFYPQDEVIERETIRNTDLVLYLLEQTACPYGAAGLGSTHCGPYSDDLEIDRGWTFTGDGEAAGQWQQSVPALSRIRAGVKQRIRVRSGQAALVTGAGAGLGSGLADVDGRTTALSRTFDLGPGRWTLRFAYAFAHDRNATADDLLGISVVSNGTTTPIWTLRGKSADRDARWRTRKVDLSAFAGQSIQLQVEALDGGQDNLLEAALDNIRVYATP